MSSPTGNPELDAKLQEIAAKHVEISQQVFELALDFSESSLQQIDDAIAKFHPEGNALDSTLLPYGAYVGETIRHNLGGVWVQDAESQTWLQNVGGGDIQVFPFTWIQKRFANGMEDSIAFKYKVVKSEVEKALGRPVEPVAPRPPAPLAPDNAAVSAQVEVLTRAPLLAFLLVAAADGKISKKEIAAFDKAVSEITEDTCPLFSQCLDRLTEDFEGYQKQLSASIEPLKELQVVAHILDTDYPDEAAPFKKALLELGLKIAQASGGFLGFGKKVSDEEMVTLALMGVALGLVEPPADDGQA